MYIYRPLNNFDLIDMYVNFLTFLLFNLRYVHITSVSVNTDHVSIIINIYIYIDGLHNDYITILLKC